MKTKNSGFTLAEVLVSIVIGVISIAAAFASYNYFNKSYKSVSQKAAINSSARDALTVIARDLRNAGYIDIVEANIFDENKIRNLFKKADICINLIGILFEKKRGNTLWNAPTNNTKLNKTTDEGSILNQASIFNGAGKVYAPRYRQAHIEAYYTKNKTASKQAFKLAYMDVKSAFEFYLKEYNPINEETRKRRPIIIASHSQGTNHATQLLKDYFDGKELQKNLIAK